MDDFTRFTTSSVKAITVSESLGVRCILPIKTGLGQNSLLDSVLKSNMDYAMKAVEALPISKRTNAVLDVAGDSTLVRIMTGQPILHYTVWNDGDGPKLLQTVMIKNTKLTTKDVHVSHFDGHCCRDGLKSCLKQAHEKVTSKEGGLSNVELKIICGELHLTYITQSPSTTIEVRPEWRSTIKKGYQSDVPRVMNHMEKSGEMSPGMLACFHHLMKHCRNYLGTNAHILLMSEGQKVELFHNEDDQAAKQRGRNMGYSYSGGKQNIVIFLGANNIPEMINEIDNAY